MSKDSQNAAKGVDKVTDKVVEKVVAEVNIDASNYSSHDKQIYENVEVAAADCVLLAKELSITKEEAHTLLQKNSANIKTAMIAFIHT